MQLSNIQEQTCKQNIRAALYDEDMPLPENLETGKVYKTSYYKNGNRGGRNLQFFITADGAGFTIDLYMVTDDYSAHKRIDSNGQVTELENFEGQFGWPVYDDEQATQKEHERIKAHNRQVQVILQQKGFEV